MYVCIYVCMYVCMYVCVCVCVCVCVSQSSLSMHRRRLFTLCDFHTNTPPPCHKLVGTHIFYEK